MYHFRNLVFEGGGVKGIAYIGAIKELNERGILPNIERVGGASAGAIYATILGLNYSIDEIDKILDDLDFQKLLDKINILNPFVIIEFIRNFGKLFGQNKGDYFRYWIGEKIRNKTGDSETTFAELETLKSTKGFKSLYIMGTNLSTGLSEVFSYETTPNIHIADAVRISMSVPFFFEAKKLKEDILVDGGVLDNYPIKLFDRKKYVSITAHQRMPDYYIRINEKIAGNLISHYVYNKETFGFRLSTEEQLSLFRDGAGKKRKINNLFDYMKVLIETFFSVQQNYHLHQDDWHRTIYIDTLGIDSLEFNISDDKKEELIKSGKDGVKKYFDDWYNDSTKWTQPSQDKPYNRPDENL